MYDVPSSKWEANLHGAGFWIQSGGGHFKVVTGGHGLAHWDVWNDKYCEPFDISRFTLYHSHVWLKPHPFDALLPRFQLLHLARIGIRAAQLRPNGKFILEVDPCVRALPLAIEGPVFVLAYLIALVD